MIDDDSDVEMQQEDEDLIFMAAEPPKKSRSESPGTSGIQQGTATVSTPQGFATGGTHYTNITEAQAGLPTGYFAEKAGRQVLIRRQKPIPGQQVQAGPQVQTGQLVQIGQQAGAQVPQYMYSVPIVDPKTGNIVTGLVPLSTEKGVPQVPPSLSPVPPSVSPGVTRATPPEPQAPPARVNTRYPMSARPPTHRTPSIPSTSPAPKSILKNQSKTSPQAKRSAATSGSLVSLEKTVKNIEPTPENDPSLKIADDLFCHKCSQIYSTEARFLGHIDDCWPKDVESDTKQATSDSVIEMLSRIKRDIPDKFKNLFKRPPASYSLSETQAKTLAVNNVLYVMKTLDMKACPICYYSTEKMKEDHPRSQSK